MVSLEIFLKKPSGKKEGTRAALFHSPQKWRNSMNKSHEGNIGVWTLYGRLPAQRNLQPLNEKTRSVEFPLEGGRFARPGVYH